MGIRYPQNADLFCFGMHVSYKISCHRFHGPINGISFSFIIRFFDSNVIFSCETSFLHRLSF
jgi:hypothetical protein